MTDLKAVAQVHMPRVIVREIDAMARARLGSRSDVVRQAILEYLKKPDKS